MENSFNCLWRGWWNHSNHKKVGVAPHGVQSRGEEWAFIWNNYTTDPLPHSMQPSKHIHTENTYWRPVAYYKRNRTQNIPETRIAVLVHSRNEEQSWEQEDWAKFTHWPAWPSTPVSKKQRTKPLPSERKRGFCSGKVEQPPRKEIYSWLTKEQGHQPLTLW